MAHISIDHVRVGMVLATNIQDRRGRLLVPAGAEIGDRHLSALRMWGIAAIDVVGEAPPVQEEVPLPEWVLAEVSAELDDRFRAAGGPHPFLDELRRLAGAAEVAARMTAATVSA